MDTENKNGDKGQLQDKQSAPGPVPRVVDKLHILRLDPGIIFSHKVISLCHKTASPKVVPQILQGGQTQMPLAPLQPVAVPAIGHLPDRVPSAGEFSC